MPSIETQSTSPPPLRIPHREASAHKGNFGRVLLIGGSRGMAGSIALSSIAALHTGSGLVAAAVPDCILDCVAGFHPALMTIGLRDDGEKLADFAWQSLEDRLSAQAAIGCGPGMTTGSGGATIVEGLLAKKDLPLVLDADALNIIAQNKWFLDGRFERGEDDAACVLTPHPGELQRLTGAPAKDVDAQVDAAAELACRLGLTIVVKGGPSHVAYQSGNGAKQVWQNTTGNPGMATAGCGDVLTGIVTSLVGQGLSGPDAARLGVWIHGRCGDEAAARFSHAGMTSLHALEALASVADEMTQPANGSH
ncbi:NAD(P)H-hydrate dehydratase [Rhodopirellula europaea]|jgi:NAD(P)H-hydrate epimerase|uniref:ADP-dependent (S)-NAD(P)H-hydrate dehydratase n=1 Tax=Rhodopirellula europaea SH398 TaxID=1263868 RepID=M5S802_9BACT|nr:NAD(P)H-hydrate dehydratase [Rhodopirellula europaea]EMI27635.1 sugar kinase [Rhodopirellula europaea SH398]